MSFLSLCITNEILYSAINEAKVKTLISCCTISGHSEISHADEPTSKDHLSSAFGSTTEYFPVRSQQCTSFAHCKHFGSYFLAKTIYQYCFLHSCCNIYLSFKQCHAMQIVVILNQIFFQEKLQKVVIYVSNNIWQI